MRFFSKSIRRYEEKSALPRRSGAKRSSLVVDEVIRPLERERPDLFYNLFDDIRFLALSCRLPSDSSIFFEFQLISRLA